MSGTTVNYSVADRVALIEIDRPDKRNAISRAVAAALVETFARFDEDDTTEVAILCGAGPAFSSGADVGEGQMLTRAELERSRDPLGIGQPLAELLHTCRNWKPVVAAVHGYALGLSLALMLECDLIVCEDDAWLQVTETPRGLGGYRHWALMKARGAAMFADDVCITGRTFSGAEAHAAGLVTGLAPKGEVREKALALARTIAANPPLSVRETVRIRRWHMHRLTQEVAFQTEGARLHLTEDFAEAVRAFAEKSAPGPFKAR